jgi:uncharacterized protein (TIGR03382 family)
MLRNVLVVSAWLLSTSAIASSVFPGAIATHLGGPRPSCTVCHTSNSGGSGTVTQATGIALKALGLVSSDTDALNAALDALEAAGTDSDAGGEGDVAELRAGTDPNDGSDDGSDPGTTPTDTLKYGFGCAQVGAAGLAPVVVAVLALRRRRRS